MKRTLYALGIYLLIFGIILIISIYDYFNNLSMIDFGLSNKITNIIVMVFSFVGLIKSIWHIHKV